ncbi:MAG: hypothetical protein VKO00_03385 [Cyanobacteriota bacterium]|nr:hypothetical protein [Cyanobacteriota bacterium]
MANDLRKAFLCLSLGAALCGIDSIAASSAKAETLYKLDTECSFNAGAAIPCTVEATQSGNATIYRHSAGKKVVTIRVSDEPSRIELMNPSTGQFATVNSAGARFSVNTVCYNNRDFCVVNPNYLNSVREESPQQFAGRDLVRVHMNKEGRINLICYDDGCEGLK